MPKKIIDTLNAQREYMNRDIDSVHSAISTIQDERNRLANLQQPNQEQVSIPNKEQVSIPKISNEPVAPVNATRNISNNINEEFGRMESDLIRAQEMELDNLLKTQSESKTSLEKAMSDVYNESKKATELKHKKASTYEEAGRSYMLTPSGREGGVSSVNKMAGEEIVSGIHEQRRLYDVALQDLSNKISLKQREIQESQESGQAQLSAQHTRELASLRAEKIAIQERQIAKEAESANLISGKRNDFLNTMASLPLNMLTDLDDEGFSALAKTFDVDLDPGLSLMMKGFSSQAKTILQDKKLDDEERNIKLNSLKYNFEQSQLNETKKAIDQIRSIDNAIDNGDIAKEVGEYLKYSLGLSEKPLTPLEIQEREANIYYKNAQSEQMLNQSMNNKQALSSLNVIYGNGANNIVNKLSTFTIGEKAITRDVNDKYLGECGAFVNDVAGLGRGFFSTSWESKISKMNKSKNEMPQIGDVFISTYGKTAEEDYGHVGFIKNITFDDKGNVLYTIADSNKNGKGLYDERTVTYDQLMNEEEVVGYYSPVYASSIQDNEPIVINNSLEPYFLKMKKGGSLTQADYNAINSITTIDDFLKQNEVFLKRTTSEEYDYAKNLLSDMQYLKDNIGYKFLAGTAGPIMPMTPTYDYRKKFDNIVSRITADEFADMKSRGLTFGALSNEELKFIQKASTDLSLLSSDEMYIDIIDKMISNLNKVIYNSPEDVLLDKSFSKNVAEITDPVNLLYNEFLDRKLNLQK